MCDIFWCFILRPKVVTEKTRRMLAFLDYVLIIKKFQKSIKDFMVTFFCCFILRPNVVKKKCAVCLIFF